MTSPHDDWFEKPLVPINFKNGIPRIGINTIGSSMGKSYDLRGIPPNPKNIISPWINQSIEPNPMKILHRPYYFNK